MVLLSLNMCSEQDAFYSKFHLDSLVLLMVNIYNLNRFISIVLVTVYNLSNFLFLLTK
jgi:hypothetical protein